MPPSRQLGTEVPSYAAFRMERILGTSIGFATPRSRASTTPRTSGTRSGSSSTAPGASPPTSTAPPRRSSAPRAGASTWPRVSAPVNTEPVDLAPEPCTRAQPGVSAYEIDPWSVPRRTKVALLQDWSRRLLAAPRRRPRRHLPVRRQGEQVLRRPRGHRDDPAAGAPVSRSSTRSPSTPTPAPSRPWAPIAPPVGRGWEYLDRHRVGLGRRARAACPGGWSRSSTPPASNRVATTWSSTRPTCG